MSLRTRQRDKLIVQNYTDTVGSEGQSEWAKSGEPFSVTCNVYPLTASESESLGLQNIETRAVHIHFGGWIGNQHSTIEHDGRTWQQIGPAISYTKGQRTGHVRLIIEPIAKKKAVVL